MNDDPRQQRLRQLGHDVKTQLLVVSLGLEALQGLRDDPEEFAQVCQEIRRDGVEPMKELIDAILKTAHAAPGTLPE
ncbi:hypothetical protein [Alienimonas californiensis]|uniref:Signal transduction histidine kinase dimerisation/phosphoacceptor domain-containing protein n=1 Tax=Alienimonas californiensis TaxID=2527989 RepID=A0A517P6L4_9PLAN|nr:hypothetical protein [Alienimonas californiensis]QDT15016.1 hypothetical protein CA12_10960 [Alienimonas californiensis]